MTTTAVPRPQLENPFLGLRSFTSEESYLYFGREGQSDELLRKMDRSRFVAILGVSGSGKSSLVRAGLLPSLYNGYLSRAGADWRVADFRPGGDPIGNLAAALSSTGFFEKGLDADLLRSSSLAIVAAAKAARDSGEWPEQENLLILADQFEELFRFRVREESAMADRDEKAAFVKLLLEAGRQQDLPIYVVITMRSDFLGDCSQFRDLPEAINNGQYLIPQMTREQRRAAIESPVKVAGEAISARLVQRILNEIGEDPGQLPIMQHALMRTFDHWCEHGEPGGALDTGDYEAIGTLTDALSTHADEAFEEARSVVPGRGEEIAKRIFQRLREQDANGREIRRPTPLGELSAVAEAAEETLAVLECFRRDKRSFVMPPTGVRLRDDTQVDITHECLLRRWKRLTGWVAEELESRRIYVRLVDRAEEHEHSRGSDFLRGAQLQVAVEWWDRRRPNRAWADRYHAGFESAEKFLRGSQEHSERERLEHEKARQAEEQRGLEELRRNQKAREEALLVHAANRQKEIRHRSTVRLMRVAITAAGVSVGLAAWAVVQTQRAKAAKEIAQVQLFASQANDTRAAAENLSVWLGLEAVSLRDPKLPVVPQAEQALHRAILMDAREVMRFPPPGGGDPSGRPPPPLRSVGFSSDGTQLLAGGDDGSAAVWDLPTGQPVPTAMHDQGSTGRPWRATAAFTADNQSVFTFCRHWPPGEHPTGRVPSRVFVAARGPDGWRAGNPFELGRDYAAFALSPDGRRFATGGPDHQIAVWDAKTGAILKRLEHHKGPVKALAFSSDGTLLASASGDGTKERPDGVKENSVAIWDVANGTVVRKIEQQPEQVLSLAFSPDGEMLAGGREDWVAIVWSVASGSKLQALRGHSDDVVSVAYSADGARLATASLDNTVRIWDAATFEPMNQITGHSKPVTGVVFHPDGTRLATSSEDGTARIWELVSEQEIVSTPGHRVPARSVSFTRDGSRLITGDSDGTLKVWSIADRWERAVMSHGAPLYGAAVSPDGTNAASAGTETVKIWDVANGALKMEFRRPPWKHAFDNVAFSPDGQLVATGGQQGPQVYSLKTGEPRTPAWQDTSQIRCVAFAPGAERIIAAGGGLDGKIRIFDADTGKLLQTNDSPGPVYSIVFSPEGKYMATGHRDGEVIVWRWNKHSASRLRTMEGHSGWVLSAAFSSDSTRLATGAIDKIIKLWDPEAGTELFSIRAHTDRVYSVSFSPNRMWLASAGSDGYIRLHPDGIPQLLATARARLYESPTQKQCGSYIREVGMEWPCDLKVDAAKAVSEANRQARVYNIAGAKEGYKQAPNPRLQLSPVDEANSAARASMISEARKLARTGHIDSAMELLARFGAKFGANVGREDVNRLYSLQLAADGRTRSGSGDSSGARVTLKQAGGADSTQPERLKREIETAPKERSTGKADLARRR